MTDDRLDPLDELASAHLDGLTTPEEAARVASDPGLAERVAAFESVRAALRSDTGAIDDEQREQAIAAALGALEPVDAAASATVTSLADAEVRRSLRRRLQVVAVAAAVAAAVALVPALTRDRDHSTTRIASAPTASTTTAAAPTADAFGKEAAPPSPAADSGAAAGAQTLAALAAPPVALGSFDDVPALVAATRAELAAESTSTIPPTTTPTTGAGTGGEVTTTTLEPPPSDAATQECLDAGQRSADDSGQSVVFSGTAKLDDRDVAVVVTEAPDGERTMTATDPERDCEVVATGSV